MPHCASTMHPGAWCIKASQSPQELADEPAPAFGAAMPATAVAAVAPKTPRGPNPAVGGVCSTLSADEEGGGGGGGIRLLRRGT